jgi:hypothetical protein
MEKYLGKLVHYLEERGGGKISWITWITVIRVVRMAGA